jgi:microcystin-dependent protein
LTGTIFGLGLSQQIQPDGEPYVGALLYIYQANTSTPVTTYSDYGLTAGNELPFPMVTDAAGRIPAFWMADGAYRVRLTDSSGNELFNENSITAIGASSATTIISASDTGAVTGDLAFTFNTSTRTGWVKCNGRTIGNAASGATERANSDTQALFEFLWNNVSDTYAPVTGGRGANAAADFAASKKIVIPSMQGRYPVGLDDMGNTAADVIAAATVTGKSGGLEEVSILTANLPSHTHTAGAITVTVTPTTGHTHSAYYKIKNVGAGLGETVLEVDDVASADGSVQTSTNLSSVTPAVSASGAVSGATGSGTVLATVSPWRAGTWFIKL